MSLLDLDENHAHYQIKAYKPGVICVNRKEIFTSIIITPTLLFKNWQPQSVEELSAVSLEQIRELKPDILLIGTGSTHVFLPLITYGFLINEGIGVEIMDTHAACRTYNVLSAEHRIVAAALIIK